MQPALRLDLRRAGALHQIRLARHGAFGGSHFNELLSRADLALADKIIQLVDQVRLGILGRVPTAVAVELAGVKVEDSVTINGARLQLNGAGIRYKGPFKVYVGDLYTTRRVSSLDDLIAAPGPKRLSMTFLRDINSAEFGKLLTRGMEDNVSKQELSKIIPGMIKMGDIFAANKSFAPGDVCSLEWDPAKGLSVYAKGKLQAEPFKDPAFYRALMSIWFGNTPADWKLKDELLGVKPQPQ